MSAQDRFNERLQVKLRAHEKMKSKTPERETFRETFIELIKKDIEEFKARYPEEDEKTS